MEEKERFELIGYCSYRDTETGVIGDNFVELLNQQDKEIIKLREENQQLHSQPAEIVEKIRKWGQKHYNWVGDGTGYDGQDYNECIGFNRAIDQLNEALGTILKKYGGEDESK